MWYVYILECQNGAYYTGVTSHLKHRLQGHREGTSHYTGTYPPIGLVYQERFLIKADAEQREAQLKRWSRAKKTALIHGDKVLLRKLSRSRD